MPKHDLEQRYADLLEKSEDVQLVELIAKLDSAYHTPVPMPNLHQFSPPAQRPFLLKITSPGELRHGIRPRRKAPARLLLAAAAVLAVLLLAAASLPLWLQAISGVAQGQADLPLSAYQNLHQSKALPGTGITITLEKGYADANRVLLIYTYTLPQQYGADPLSVSGTMTADPHLVLPDITAGTIWNTASSASGDSKTASVLSYDASSITGNPGTLNIHLTLTHFFVEVSPPAGGGSVQDPTFSGTLTFDVALPFHPGKVLQPHQTMTAGGQAITLERVVITPSETVLSFSGIQRLDHLSVAQMMSGKLQVDEHTINLSFRGTDCHPKVDTIHGCLVVAEIQRDNFAETGPWSITLMQNLSWTFHFNVP
jgi:hypothetical protein